MDPNSLEALLQKAERATSPPQDPANGIPKQRLPSWIRYAIRALLLPILYLEIGAEKIAKFFIRPPFKRVGTCKRRGNCCHYILFPETKGIVKKLFSFWSTEINGFYQRDHLVYEHEGKPVYVYGCRYLKKDGSCANYLFRPKICRTWPLIEHFGYPRILKGCGYQAKLRKPYAKKHPHLQILDDS
jgi:Fe-S-cluster containining protein